MRKGLMIGTEQGPNGTIDKLIELGKTAEAMGYDNLWMANIFGHDAITTLSLIGRETTRIGLGTAVTPSYPRHPTALAQQVLTASAASKGRFTLGIGLSHKMVIEDMLGLSYDKPAAHMKEYLQILIPLLNGEQVSHQGSSYRVNLQLEAADRQSTPVVLAALGPLMLRIAGSLTDGTTTWMTGLKTLQNHIIPSIRKAASDAEKPDPSIVAGLPIALTNDIAQAKEKIDKGMAIYGILPSYRAMMDREGVDNPGDVALLGDEKALEQKVRQLKDIGVTDFNAYIFPLDADCFGRTSQWLAELKL